MVGGLVTSHVLVRLDRVLEVAREDRVDFLTLGVAHRVGALAIPLEVDLTAAGRLVVERLAAEHGCEHVRKCLHGGSLLVLWLSVAVWGSPV